MTSKFKAILDAKRQGETQPKEPPAGNPPPTSGRPPGKRRQADYKQISAYIRKDTHRAAMIRLAQDGSELSDLVESLLADWLKREYPST